MRPEQDVMKYQSESVTSTACALCVHSFQWAQRTWQWPAELCGLIARRPSDAMVYRYAMNLVREDNKFSSSIWSANAVKVAKKLLDDASVIDDFRTIVDGIGIVDRIILGRRIG